MDVSIVVAALIALAGTIIASLFAYFGVRASIKANEAKVINAIASELEKYTAVTDTKLENLTKEVRQHNNFAVKIPVMEQQIKTHEELIKEMKEDIKELQNS